MNKPGLFITLEGIDGSGKSTQARLLAARLGARLTREPGGSPGAEDIRALLVEGQPGRWSPETECLLFTAARRDHVERVIRPALLAGETIVCDRFADSTRVYQGTVRAELRKAVDLLHELFIGLEPDLTFVLDMPPEAALRRHATRARAPGPAQDRFERFGLAFQARLAEGFRALAQEFPKRVRVVDADRAPEVIAAELFTLVEAFKNERAAHGP